MAKYDVTIDITNQFIEAIEEGIVKGSDWVKPWTCMNGMPVNGSTDKEYCGINALILMSKGSGQFATYKQWNGMGGKLENAKGMGVKILRPLFSKKDDHGDQHLYGWASHTVFHQSLITGIEFPKPDVEGGGEFNRVQIAERLVELSGATLNHGGDKAFYSPHWDSIQMPLVEQFKTTEEYYGVLLHELTHWTKHTSRLNRKTDSDAGGRAFEELVAELGAAFLCNELGIHQGYREDHARYLASWVTCLKNDSKAIMRAASQAQKAKDYLMKFIQVDEVQEDVAA